MCAVQRDGFLFLFPPSLYTYSHSHLQSSASSSVHARLMGCPAPPFLPLLMYTHIQKGATHPNKPESKWSYLRFNLQIYKLAWYERYKCSTQWWVKSTTPPPKKKKKKSKKRLSAACMGCRQCYRRRRRRRRRRCHCRRSHPGRQCRARRRKGGEGLLQLLHDSALPVPEPRVDRGAQRGARAVEQGEERCLVRGLEGRDGPVHGAARPQADDVGGEAEVGIVEARDQAWWGWVV
jgi:hypothetical protein